MEIVLNTFGVSLNRDNEAFVITKKGERHCIPVDDVKSIQIFIMYDIESNKVRYNIVKYLERMGCYRMQKSIFLGNLSMEKYEKIKSDMVEVQSLYENHDSIIVCPVSSDILRSMKIIGQNINLDVITQNKNTLFF